MKLRPYPEYIASGVAVPTQVPIHWSRRSLGSLLTRLSARKRVDLPLLSVVREKGVILRSDMSADENHNYVPDDLSNYQVVPQGALVINKMKAWQGSMGISAHEGVVSPAYFVFRCKFDDRAYLERQLRSRPWVALFAQASDGVRIGQWDLSIDRMRRIPVIVAPSNEQVAIVRFLDHMDRRINRLIRAKRRLIALLNEQKQAIINRAVTRGLDPGVRLKPSGVDWLGDIPKHWDILPFTKCAIERADYRGATPEKVESGTFLVTAKNVKKGWIDYDTSKEYVRTAEYDRIMRRGLPQRGDILLTTEAPLGNVALVDREDVAFAQRIIRFRLHPSAFFAEFALLSMLSPYFQEQLAVRSTGSTAIGIKASKLPQLQILKPPLAEQIDLVNGISAETTRLERAISSAAAEIELTREYRTRLIADVVTGKLDVREAAAHLPSEAEEGERADELEAEGEEEGKESEFAEEDGELGTA